MAQNLIKEVTTIWGIGRNYALHAKELGNEAPSEPVVFIKSPAAIVSGDTFFLPSWTTDIHHELELAVLVGKNNRPSHVALALDLTAREIQQQLKKKQLPWALAKTFPQSCPISPFIEYKGDEWFSNLSFQLAINQTVRQFGQTSDMIFTLPQLLAYLEQHFPLRTGDLILTGTPEGVGPLQKGDVLEAEIPGEFSMRWMVK